MMTRSLTLNVDSDGVLYDWHGWMIPYLAKHTGHEMTLDDFSQWDMAASLGISKKEFYKIFDRAIYDGAFAYGSPIPGAVEAVSTLVDAGHRVRIVTNKSLAENKKSQRAMEDFLIFYGNHFGNLDQVEIVFTGSRYGKSGYPADVVIDDKPDLSWTQLYPAVNVLFDQPWNQGVRVDYLVGPGAVLRASGWTDVLELVEQMGGGILIDKSDSDRSPVVV